MRKVHNGPKIIEPAPNPNTASPVISPFFSGNHLTEVVMGVAYVRPNPKPPISP